VTDTSTLTTSGPFSLAASIAFLEAFTPASVDARHDDHLHLACCVDGSWQPVAACARDDGGRVAIEWEGPAGDAVPDQVARILSLDVDGEGFAAVGDADPVVGALQRRYPGLRPVCFWSAYEAACWAVISQRIRIVQAADLKARITREHGHPVAIHGEELVVFPSPSRLLEVADQLPLPDVKVERLRGVATTALGTDLLLGAHLRSLDPADAVEAVQAIDGIGPFSAEHIVVRGAGAPDRFPETEARLLDSMRTAYGRPGASTAELAAVAEAWRPYRSWVSVLLRKAREDDTGEITGRPVTRPASTGGR